MSKKDFDGPAELGDFVEQEERVLEARLKAARAVLTHPGEKGRALEGVVMNLLRDFLPAEYGLGTGFIAYLASDGPKLTEQLDIIIYDALRCGPIARLEACEVYPLEAVYGYVEVKTEIKGTATEKAEKKPETVAALVRQSKRLRGLLERVYWGPDSTQRTVAHLHRWQIPVSIRSFVFAFSCDGEVSDETAEVLKTNLETATERIGGDAFISGMYVGGVGFFRCIPVESEDDPRRFAYKMVTNGSLSAMKTYMLHGLARFPRIPLNVTPALELYWPKVLPDCWEKYLQLRGKRDQKPETPATPFMMSTG
jgi:hypothetical protein